MASVHLLNVAPGDCTVIRHNSGRVSMIDICGGNDVRTETEAASESGGGNFRMCEKTINPLDYLKEIGATDIFRFILSHPDMDHMDGLHELSKKHNVANFWDSGSRRTKPDFSSGHYHEKDWDTYVAMRDGTHGTTKVGVRQAGDAFAYANKKDDAGNAHDGLYILAPDDELIKDPNMSDDINEGSYVILYRSSGGRVVLPGDAHDKGWEYVLNKYREGILDVSFLLAPHHGRDSERSYEFLDAMKPKLTLLGCAPSKHIDYNQWRSRNLEFITSNQAGNVVLEAGDGAIDVYVQNREFAKSKKCDLSKVNGQGYVLYKSIAE